jgi:hypothetical protein
MAFVLLPVFLATLVKIWIRNPLSSRNPGKPQVFKAEPVDVLPPNFVDSFLYGVDYSALLFLLVQYSLCYFQGNRKGDLTYLTFSPFITGGNFGVTTKHVFTSSIAKKDSREHIHSTTSRRQDSQYMPPTFSYKNHQADG